MNLTSSLDYSLTKKRLKMMSRNSSRVRTNFARIVLLPLVGITSLVFCTDRSSSDYFFLSTRENENVYYNLEIGYYPAIPSKGNALEYYTRDGGLVNDTLRTYRKKDDKLLHETVYEEGLFVSSTRFDSTGAQKTRTEFTYDQGFSSGYRLYDENNTLIKESMGSILVPGRGDGSMKEWYPNGQLKFEMATDSNRQYQGMMTMYAENGDVLQQELYKDGELVEKIK